MKTDQAECAYLETSPEELTEKPEAQNPAAEKRKRKPQPVVPNENFRSAILNADDAEIKEKKEVEGITDEKAPSDISKIEESAKLEQPIETIPERILKIAEAIKEESGDTKDKMIIVEVKEENVAENPNTEKRV